MNITVNQLLELIDSPDVFFNKLSYINNENELIHLCELLKEKKEIDYFSLTLEAIKKEEDIFMTTHTLGKIVHLSILDETNILKLYEFIYDLMKEDLAGGEQYNITKKISDINKDFAIKLLTKLYSINKEYCIFHISTIHKSLHKKHKIDQYEDIKKYLINTEDLNKTQSSINVFNNINIAENQAKELYYLFENILNLDNLECTNQIIFACDELKNDHPRFKNILLAISNSKNPNIKYQLSRILFLNKSQYIEEEWFKKCFFSLSKTKSNEIGIIRNISFILTNILDNTKSTILIESFFLEWVKNSDISSNFPEKELNHFIHKFESENPQLLNKFITNILNSDNYKAHLIIDNFLSSSTKLEQEIISKLEHKDILFICKKILGYLYEFKIQTSLIWSILEKENLTKENKDLVVEVFTFYIGKDYAYDTLKYFKELNKDSLNKDQKEVSKTIIKNLELEKKKRENLKQLKELIPPSYESREIFKAEQAQMSKAMEKAQEGSLSSLFTKIFIRYGKGSFHNMQGKYTEPTKMQKISSTMTIPISERIHPIHKSINKYHFKIAKKGD